MTTFNILLTIAAFIIGAITMLTIFVYVSHKSKTDDDKPMTLLNNNDMALKIMNIYHHYDVFKVDDMLADDGLLCIRLHYYDGAEKTSYSMFFSDTANYNFVFKYVDREERKRKIEILQGMTKTNLQ